MTAGATRSPAPKIRAPELRGRGWLNTGDRELGLVDFRGRFLLLDFWTFCCVNCLHVLDELRPLERRFAQELVVVGVHSPKFEHEADPQALAAAVQRYDVRHPVLDDPELTTWNAYTAKAWPTLVLVDPLGYVVCQMAGEGHAAGLAATLEQLIAEHKAAGTLHRGAGPYQPPAAPSTRLRFPGKVIALPGGTLLVSDTAHHQLVELEADLVTERRRFGTGERGLTDGPADQARFSEPQGLLLLPPEVAASVGYDVVVADSVNHALRGVRLAGPGEVAPGDVRTVAGTGQQLRLRAGAGPATRQPLSTPWDVAWFAGAVVVAMAGTHQLWRFRPEQGDVAVWAGTSNEGLVDGDLAGAWFAQPCGLAVDRQGALWVADSETSALRRVAPLTEPAAGAARAGSTHHVATAIGHGLFDFGHRDGPAEQALMQHPLGVAVLPDGSVAVADTYNGAVRRYDPVTGQVGTLFSGLAEPSDLLVDGEHLVVVESAAHRLVRIAIPRAHLVDGVARRTQRPATDLAPGAVELRIVFTPPTGQKLDHRFGDPTLVEVSASPAAVLADGTGRGKGLVRHLVLAGEPGTQAVLHVSAQAAACDAVGAGAACYLYQQDWGVPIRLAEGGPGRLELHLLG